MSAPPQSGQALMIYIEPTPYIDGLINAVRHAWPDQVDVRYLTSNLSQSWNLHVAANTLLPPSRITACREIWRALRQKKYKIVHLAGWGTTAFVWAMIAGRLLRIPVVVETDSHFAAGQSLIKRALKNLWFRLLFRLPRGFLPGGNRQKNYLLHYGVDESRVRVAQMTVDVDAISERIRSHTHRRTETRTKYAIGPGDVVFLFVGRLEPVKGIEDLIAAFQRVADSSSFKLLIAGDGRLRADVERAAKDCPKIEHLGRITGDALIDTYGAADALILPSHFEPWGLVANEAMAAGLPIIASNRVGAVGDLVRHGDTGLVFEATDQAALAAAISTFGNDDALRKQLGHAAQKCISQWTLANEANNVIGFWRQLLC